MTFDGFVVVLVLYLVYLGAASSVGVRLSMAAYVACTTPATPFKLGALKGLPARRSAIRHAHAVQPVAALQSEYWLASDTRI